MANRVSLMPFDYPNLDQLFFFYQLDAIPSTTLLPARPLILVSSLSLLVQYMLLGYQTLTLSSSFNCTLLHRHLHPCIGIVDHLKSFAVSVDPVHWVTARVISDTWNLSRWKTWAATEEAEQDAAAK